jgi:hypothetical protein
LSANALSKVIVAIGYKDEFQRDVVDKLSLKATANCDVFSLRKIRMMMVLSSKRLSSLMAMNI